MGSYIADVKSSARSDGGITESVCFSAASCSDEACNREESSGDEELHYEIWFVSVVLLGRLEEMLCYFSVCPVCLL